MDKKTWQIIFFKIALSLINQLNILKTTLIIYRQSIYEQQHKCNGKISKITVFPIF